MALQEIKYDLSHMTEEECARTLAVLSGRVMPKRSKVRYSVAHLGLADQLRVQEVLKLPAGEIEIAPDEVQAAHQRAQGQQ